MDARMRVSLFAGVMLACTVAAQSAHAADIYNGLTLAQLKTIFVSAGKTISESGSDYIRLSDGPLVQLADCPDDKNGVCYEVEFSRTFNNEKPTFEAVNKWNLTTKIPEASVNGNGELHFEMWVTAVGVTDQLLLDTATWFDKSWSGDSELEFWKPYAVDSGK